MKNKLLLTSALAGSLIAGSALAQTSITGDLVVNYRAASFDNNAGLASKRGFGRESQVNVQSKGKLSNGMDYAAGFALEFDGQNNAGSQGASEVKERNTISNENVYFDLINGNTVITVGVDHMQRVYAGATPQVTDNIDDVNYTGAATTFLVGANSTESAGIGIMQRNVAGFSLGAYYVPVGGDFGGYDTGRANTPTATPRNSSYELTAIGADAFGVKGLSVALQYNKEDKQITTNIGDTKSRWAGIGYNAGQFALGVDRIINTKEDAAAADANEDKTNRYGVTFAAAKDITIGLNQFRTERTNASTGKDGDKEKSTAIQVGYNLGPVSAIANISRTENINFVNGTDADMITLRLVTKF